MGDNLRLSSKQASITAGKAYYKKHADEINSALVLWIQRYIDVEWHFKYKVIPQKKLVLKKARPGVPGRPFIALPSYDRRLEPSTWPPSVWLWLVLQDNSIYRLFLDHVPAKHKDAVELVFNWMFPTNSTNS